MSEPEENEKTWLQRPLAARPTPGADATTGGEADNNALEMGTKIDEFEVIGLVGVGGFGIVYLAHDNSLGRLVALKEYMPSSLAARIEGLTVAVKSARLAETFAIGLRSFVNEARMLAQFDHPSLVKVYRFWEGNGTAYMVMPFYEGVTLKQCLQKLPGPPTEAWLRGVMDPLLEALEVLHHANCFHRDIAPDNILLLNDGRPVLLDFGAARRVISDRTQALTVILKPGYAPLEQYAEVPHVKQGAWTDLYALAAVVYNAVTGRPPTPSVGRSINDTMVPLAKVAAGRYSASFLAAIDRALAVRPEDRPQSVAEFRALLQADESTVAKPAIRETKEKPAPHEPASPVTASRKPLLAGGVGVLLLVVAGALYLLQPKPAVTPSTALPVIEPAKPSVTPSTAVPPVTTSSAGGTTAVPTEPAGQVVTTDRQEINEKQLVDLLLGKNGATDSAKRAAKAFDPVDMLREIYEQRAVDFRVTVVPEKAKVSIGKDKLRFRVTSLKPGYVYVLMVGTDKQFNLVFPNAIDADNGIAGDGELSLPRPGWAMTASGPVGTNYFVALVSENRRDFSAAGLKKVDPFAEFPRKLAEKIAAESPLGGANPFAGKVICPSGRHCSALYGAALFAIEEVE
ncbi:serine/threonine-protein kinase [Accumulibacter sp.]|uniref:serine/threonine-protein kinase n=1 Tax=Accumulibacter sp. TaxID=2053492 RepID=UPI00260C0436|nr:serine/threonine-protein kinase [Accumulibacter sp.]